MSRLIIPVDRFQSANRAHAKATGYGRLAILAAYKAGRELLKAKELCPHGKFAGWLREYFNGSQRTAQIYMRIAKNWGRLKESARQPALLTLEAAVKFLAKPKEEPKDLEPVQSDLADQLSDGRCWLGRHEAKEVLALFWPATKPVEWTGSTHHALVAGDELSASRRPWVNKTFGTILPYIFDEHGITAEELDWIPISADDAQQIVADWGVAEMLEATHWRHTLGVAQ